MEYLSKNLSDLDYLTQSEIYGYVFTPDDNYILVGEDEDEYLIWYDGNTVVISKSISVSIPSTLYPIIETYNIGYFDYFFVRKYVSFVNMFLQNQHFIRLEQKKYLVQFVVY